MTLDNMTGITEGSYTGFCKSQLITCNRVKECNGVCPFEDALKHADKTQTMNEQHIINHDRDWIIGCIEHDGFIHTHRFDKANQIIHDALSAEAEWIPISEGLPKEHEWVGTKQFGTTISDKVHITFDVNGERFVKTLSLQNGELSNYEKRTMDTLYKGWKMIAWMPLPKPYREDGGGE